MKFTSKQLKEMSNAVRAGALRAIRAAGSGHVGIVLGASDIITTIYANHLRRGVDKFVLSAGHGSAMLYSVLKLAGYKISELAGFRKIGGLAGHPEFGTDGVSATTGPLGQGIANAVGMALASKILEFRFESLDKSKSSQNSEIKNNDSCREYLNSKLSNLNSKIYCLCGDGDLSEGVAGEAIAFAGQYELDNLILFWDDNGITMDGAALTDIDMPGRMAAAGWDVYEIDGNNFDDIEKAIDRAKAATVPVFVKCKTIIGNGSSVANTPAAHGLAIDDAELAALIKKFESDNGVKLWSKFPSVGGVAAGRGGLAKFETRVNHPVGCADTPPTEGNFATRELSGEYLKVIVPKNPNMIGGSADLATSTNTRVPDQPYIEYGVREHAMAAIMNGMATMGLRPYGATFLAFSDYMRPAIRLAALGKIPTIFVFTHDSIAVGEDGPTHQPVEQIASLRLIPNLNVFRPCNAAEVKWAWDTALSDTDRPSAIILSRQKFEQIRTPNKVSSAYVIYKSEIRNQKSEITLLATGSEVPLAVAVAKILGNANVVSMPSVEKFRKSGDKNILRGRVIAIEAGASAAWFEFADAVVGIDEFGTSGPGGEVYAHFGFDAKKIADEIRKLK